MRTKLKDEFEKNYSKFIFFDCVADDNSELNTIHKAYQYLMKTYVDDVLEYKAKEEKLKEARLKEAKIKEAKIKAAAAKDNLESAIKREIFKQDKKQKKKKRSSKTIEQKKSTEEDNQNDSTNEHDDMYKRIENLVGKMNMEDPPYVSKGLFRRGSRILLDDNFVAINKTRRKMELPRCISSLRTIDEMPQVC